MATIRIIESQQRDLWNRFVLASPESTYFHLFEWTKVIEQTYGMDTRFLGAFEGETLIAVLPAVITKKGGSKAVSLAFGTYGGWLFAPGADAGEVRVAFMQFLAGERVTQLENRQIGDPPSGIPADQVTQRTLLARQPEELWKRLDPKVRNQVRKAQKEGLVARWGLNQLEDFFSVYSVNMHYLGTPPHPRSFFSAMIEAFPELVELLTIRLDDKPLAAMLLMKFKRQLADPWAASLREYASLCPNMLMYWEAMKYGCERGFEEFDLGRSRMGSGPFKFKGQWGAKAIPLNYQVVSMDGQGKLNSHPPSASPLLPWFGRLWRLVPLKMSSSFSSVVRRRLP